MCKVALRSCSRQWLSRMSTVEPTAHMKIRTLLVPLALAFVGPAAADNAAPKPAARIEISVTQAGFNPDKVSVPAKKPVTLVFTRKTEATCAKSVVLTMDDGKKIERALPLDKPVELAVTF